MTMTSVTPVPAVAGAVACTATVGAITLAGASASAAPVVPHEERTPEQQAYPQRLGAGWQVSPGKITDLMQAYLKRSLPMISAGRNPGDAAAIPETATGIASAIGMISNLGGVHVSIDAPIPLTLPAWQQASDLYAISRDPRIPLKTIPLYGAMLAMSRNRLELLALLSFRPLPKEGLNVPADAGADELIAAIRTVAPDLFFENIVKSGLAYCLCRHLGRGCGMPTIHAIERWVEGLNKLFSVEAGEASMLRLLQQQDAQVRGGALANEASFQRERDLFLNGRVTGVSFPSLGASLDAVELDMAVRGSAHGVVHTHGASVDAQLVSRLKLVPKKSPAILLQTVEEGSRALQGHGEWLHALSFSGSAAPSLQPQQLLGLRAAVASLIRSPARQPLRILSQDVHLDARLRKAIKYLQRALDADGLTRSEALEILEARSTGLGDAYGPLDREMILNVLSGLVPFGE